MRIPYCYDAVAQAERREAEADRGAIKCDCCGGLIRIGEAKFTLFVGGVGLTICRDCEGQCAGSGMIHGYEDDDEIVYL